MTDHYEVTTGVDMDVWSREVNDLSYGMAAISKDRWMEIDGKWLNLWNGVVSLYDSPSMPVRGLGVSFEGVPEDV